MADGKTWREVAQRTGGADYAHRFAATFDAREASGQDVHGEAAFVASLVPPGSSVLDGGCGTGRVAGRLASLGYDVVGADIDELMIAVARERSPEITWQVAGLAEMSFGTTYDVVVTAGNVIPFVEASTLPAALANMAAHAKAGGFVVSGFGWDADHLPPGAPIVSLSAYDAACTAAGLALVERYSTWDRQVFENDGYAVSVHRKL